MSYEKFTVEKLVSTRSGNYAKYVSANGVTTLTGNFGYKVGDTVEVWDYDGYAPARIDVNGKTIWREQNRVEYWAYHDRGNTNLCNPYKK